MLNLCKISSHNDKRCFSVGKADFLRGGGAKFSPPPSPLVQKHQKRHGTERVKSLLGLKKFQKEQSHEFWESDFMASSLQP